MPLHTVVLHDGITESDVDRLKSLVASAGGQIISERKNKLQFQVPSTFDLHLITKNLSLETISDHP